MYQEYSNSGTKLVTLGLKRTIVFSLHKGKRIIAIVLFERLYSTCSTIAMLLPKEKLPAISTAHKLTFVLLKVLVVFTHLYFYWSRCLLSSRKKQLQLDVDSAHP